METNEKREAAEKDAAAEKREAAEKDAAAVAVSAAEKTVAAKAVPVPEKAPAAVAATATPLFQIHDANVVRASKTILHVGDFSLAEGEHVALLGPNGAGKSTFIQLLTREVFPLWREEPPVRFRGQDRPQLTEIKRTLGIVSSTMHDQVRVHLPVIDIVVGGLFGTLGVPLRTEVDQKDRALALDALDRLGIAELAPRDVMTLSTGQVRRVAGARPAGPHL